MRRYFHYHSWRFRQYSGYEPDNKPSNNEKSNVPQAIRVLYITFYFIFSLVGMIITLSLGIKEFDGFTIFILNLICLGISILLLYGLLSTIFDYKSRKIKAILLSIFSVLYLITITSTFLFDILYLSELPMDKLTNVGIALIVFVILWIIIFISFWFLLPYYNKKDILFNETKTTFKPKQIEMDLSEIKPKEVNNIKTPTLSNPIKKQEEDEDMETKREKFVKLTELRTNKIIETLRLLGNCSNSYMYDYTDEDVEKIFSAIEKEVEDCKKKFKGIKIQKFKL